MSNTINLTATGEREKLARTLATNLHARHCHSEEGEECTWNYESWEGADNSDFVRPKYLAKANKLLNYFHDIDEVNKMIKFLCDINPKLAHQLVKEL